MKKRFVVFCFLIPVIISVILIGAHFLRSGNVLIPILSLLLVMALCIREPLVARTVQFVLLLATAEWIHAAYVLISTRVDAGLPWTKLGIILGSVGALSLASIGLFLTKTLKEMYHLSDAPDDKVQSREGEHGRDMTETSRVREVSLPEHRQKLLAVHSLKSNLTICSLLAFLIMDYSVGVGVAFLVVIGLVNIGLRTKIQGIGGILPSEDRRKLYVRQIIGFCLFALPSIGYYSFLLPTMKHRLIVGSIITAFTLLLWLAARFEYLYTGQER